MTLCQSANALHAVGRRRRVGLRSAPAPRLPVDHRRQSELLGGATAIPTPSRSEHVANADQPAAYGNPLNADRLRVAIEANLAAQGIQRVERPARRPIASSAMPSARARCSTTTTAAGAASAGARLGLRLGGWGPGLAAAGATMAHGCENETRIAVDVFDAKSHKPIWHGAVSQNHVRSDRPERRSEDQRRHRGDFRQVPDRRAAACAAAGCRRSVTAPLDRCARLARRPVHEQVVQRAEHGAHRQHQQREAVQRALQQLRMLADRRAEPRQHRAPEQRAGQGGGANTSESPRAGCRPECRSDGGSPAAAARRTRRPSRSARTSARPARSSPPPSRRSGPKRRTKGRPSQRAPQYISEAPTQEPAVPASTTPTRDSSPLGMGEIGGRRNDDLARNRHERALERHQPGDEPVAALVEGGQIPVRELVQQTR